MATEEVNRAGIIIHDRTGHEYEKSLGKKSEFMCMVPDPALLKIETPP